MVKGSSGKRTPTGGTSRVAKVRSDLEVSALRSQLTAAHEKLAGMESLIMTADHQLRAEQARTAQMTQEAQMSHGSAEEYVMKMLLVMDESHRRHGEWESAQQIASGHLQTAFLRIQAEMGAYQHSEQALNAARSGLEQAQASEVDTQQRLCNVEAASSQISALAMERQMQATELEGFVHQLRTAVHEQSEYLQNRNVDFRKQFVETQELKEELQQKDLKLVLQAANDIKLALPGASIAHQYFNIVERAGGADEGTQALIKAYEMQADKQARSK